MDESGNFLIYVNEIYRYITASFEQGTGKRDIIYSTYSSRLLTDLTKGEEINAGDYLSLEVF